MIVGVCRLIANHLHLAIFESTPEVRVLSSAGITRLQRSYDPVRLPPMPPPKATLRPLPSHRTGLPRLRPIGSLSRPEATFVTRLQPMRLPAQAARQLPDQSTTIRVESSSTDDSRPRGALPLADSCTAAN